MVDSVTDATFDKAVLKASGPVVVFFWAVWSQPCKMMIPILDELAKSLGSKVAILQLDIDDNPSTPDKYGITSIPALILFKDGQAVSRHLGDATGPELERWITASG